MNLKQMVAGLLVLGLNTLTVMHTLGVWGVFSLPLCFFAGYGIAAYFEKPGANV